MRDQPEDGGMDISQVEVLVEGLVNEILDFGVETDWDVCQMDKPCESDVEQEIIKAWDDVHGGGLPFGGVCRARH